MNTSSYELKTKLPSCRVTVDLIRAIEQYLLRVYAEPPFQFEIQLIGDFGKLTLGSIDGFTHSYLPSDTESVNIRLWDMVNGAIQLDFSASTAELRLETKGSEARDRGLRIRREILLILEPYETLDRIVNNTGIFALTIATGALGIYILGAYPILQHTVYGYVPPLFVLFPLFVTKYKPYSLCDTKTNAQRHKIMNWILLAIGSTLIGSVARAILKIT